MTDLARKSVQCYPRPPALEPLPQPIIVRLGGVIVADTTHALRVLGTYHAPTYYLPPGSIPGVMTGFTCKPRAGRQTVLLACAMRGNCRMSDFAASVSLPHPDQARAERGSDQS